MNFRNLPERYPDVVASLKEAGCKNKANIETVKFHLTKVLNIYRPETLTNHLMLMCQFGYLKPVEGENGIFEIIKRD